MSASTSSPPIVVPGLQGLGRFLPGLVLSAALAGLAVLMAGNAWVQKTGLSALSLAILLGMVVGNTVYPRFGGQCGPGVGISKQFLLRAGIVLYGLRLTMQDLGHVGVAGLLIDAVVVCSTFVVARWVGVRWLGLDPKIAMLIGAGSSICGAAAVLATEPVVRGRAEQVAVAVATVVVFGTIATFIYPLLFELNRHWGFIPGDAQAFGIYIGSTVHEVAQVVAAANNIGPEATDAAVIAKMVRVMMLAPFLIGLSAWLARNPGNDEPRATDGRRQGGVTIPWFAVGFVGVVLFNSMQLLSPALISEANKADNFVLAMAMASLGLGTHFGAIRRAGMRPLLLALLLFVWLVAGGALLNRVVLGWLG